MLNQPVPNPVAKNPNIYTHKVFAAVGLILIGTIIAVAGIWWYMENQNTTKEPEDNSVKVSTSSAKPATVSSKKSTEEEWVTYTGKNIFADFSTTPPVLINYSFEHPKSWKEAYTAVQGLAVVSSHYENWLDDPPKGRFDVSGMITNQNIDKTGKQTTFGGKVAWKKITSGSKETGYEAQTIDYQVESVQTLQNETVKYNFQCRYFTGTNEDFETICDKIAKSFKFL